MNRQVKRIAGYLLLGVALSACSFVTPPDANRLLLGLEPVNELGYEVTPQGITVEARTLRLSTKPGMPTTTVTGYRVEYYDENGALVDQTSEEPQSLNVTVPAGWQCPEPDPALGCNAMSPGARPAPGIPATVAAVQNQFLNAVIIEQHIAAGMPTGWYADVTLFYYNAFGEFEEIYRL